MPDTPHAFNDEWSFQRSMSKGNPMAGKGIASTQPCFDCGVVFAEHVSPTMPDTLSREDLRCSAIWNGCKCDRYPHEGNGHVWRNTLDGDLVDPALYPSAAHIDALTAAPPKGTRLVLMSEELALELGASRVEWGEPDEHGWYTPTLYMERP